MWESSRVTREKCILFVLMSFVYSGLKARGRSNSCGSEVDVGGTRFHYLLSPAAILNIQHSDRTQSLPVTFGLDCMSLANRADTLGEAAQSLRRVFVWPEIELGAEPGSLLLIPQSLSAAPAAVLTAAQCRCA